MTILVTGGAGFIGSELIRQLIRNSQSKIINVDCLTYSGNVHSLAGVEDKNRYCHEKVDIRDRSTLSAVFQKHKPSYVIHLAAESHVDRSIDSPKDSIETNIIGTFNLLEASRELYLNSQEMERKKFRFQHVSTDEVYGDLDGSGFFFTEETPYAPSSPYSASKASSDHLVRSWGRTFGLPILISNCSNNYGPYQFPEKLIPTIILNALNGTSIPIYGDGQQIRDWLFVEDHVEALIALMLNGKTGETYNIGGNNEVTNIGVAYLICDLLEELIPTKPVGVKRFKDLITFVKDRPGHDQRYAIDASKIKAELSWVPTESFQSGIRKTVMWYLDNDKWWGDILSGKYRLKRLGGNS